MATEDIFGYDVDVKEKQVVAARNAALDLGDGRIALVQSIQGGYGHQTSTVYEAGSSSVYFVNGNPQGNLNYSTLVGTDGWFAGIVNKSGLCATIRSINVDLMGNADSNCDVQIKSKANIKFEGALLESIQFSIQASDLQISNSGRFRCAKLMVV
jgi:hypothetical protein